MGKLLVTVILAMVVFACSSEEKPLCTNLNTVKVLPHAMDYFYFDVGSWWVYEEEKTGKTDSIWVVLKDHEKNSGNHRDCLCGYGKCTETINLYFLSKGINTLDSGGFLWVTLRSDYEKGKCVIEESGKTLQGGYIFRMFYHDYNYMPEKYPNGFYENLSSIEVNGKTYSDILHLYHDSAVNQGYDWLQEAWYAKNIYLVKFTKADSTTWNLIKYNIVK